MSLDIGAIIAERIYQKRRTLYNLILGGHFKTQLTHLETLFHQGLLRFEKFGHIDKISNHPEGNALFVDFDYPSKAITVRKMHSLFRITGLHPHAICYSRSKRGWHVVALIMEKLNRMERVAMENILGDDSMRGALNFSRARVPIINKFWRQRWNILYDYKVTK